MNIIETLGVDELALRGKGVEFNKFSRMFKSKAEALEAVAAGDYTPTPGQANAVIVLGQGIMIYSFDILDFVLISEFIHAGDQSNRYITLDGVNDHIEFDNAGNVLDFTQDFSVGVTLVGVGNPTTPVKYKLFGRGGVQITLIASTGTNWGLYVTSDNDLYNTDKRAEANTWYAPGDFTRILFVYTAADRKLKYYLGEPSTGVFAQRANLTISQTMVDGQNITGGLDVGKPFSGVGGAGFSAVNWEGGVNNLVLSDLALTGPHLTEYFQTGEAFTEMELYADLSAYCKLGEDTFPNVVDSKGFLTNGLLVNGTAEDFKDIPTE